MGFWFFCCVALCLLRAGPVDSRVMQTPKYLIQVKGQQATLKCSPVSGHLSVYWYQQNLDQGFRFLIQYYSGEERDKGNIPDRFSVRQFPDSSSELTLRVLELGDSALFLCASSLAQRCMVPSLLYKNISLYSRK
ncbi:T-cell receptor beta chain T17T-22 [Heterocephalus glaber]|nr:T-cell receptor beta chain T17T-22 [Heterocephalus glaber]